MHASDECGGEVARAHFGVFGESPRCPQSLPPLHEYSQFLKQEAKALS